MGTLATLGWIIPKSNITVRVLHVDKSNYEFGLKVSSKPLLKLGTHQNTCLVCIFIICVDMIFVIKRI